MNSPALAKVNQKSFIRYYRMNYKMRLHKEIQFAWLEDIRQSMESCLVDE